MDERQVLLNQAKNQYKTALKNLEKISDEIHQRRRSSVFGPRGCGVGSEDEGVQGAEPKHDSSSKLEEDEGEEEEDAISSKTQLLFSLLQLLHLPHLLFQLSLLLFFEHPLYLHLLHFPLYILHLLNLMISSLSSLLTSFIFFTFTSSFPSSPSSSSSFSFCSESLQSGRWCIQVLCFWSEKAVL